MKRILLIAALAIFFVNFFSACDEDPVEPTETLTAKVNGKDFKAHLVQGGDAIRVQYSPPNFFIHAANTTQGFERAIRLDIQNFSGTGTYILDNKKPNRGMYRDNNIPNDSEHYTDSLLTGTVEVKIDDKTKKRVSGTFSFEAANFSGDTVRITNGAFDVEY